MKDSDYIGSAAVSQFYGLTTRQQCDLIRSDKLSVYRRIQITQQVSSNSNSVPLGSTLNPFPVSFFMIEQDEAEVLLLKRANEVFYVRTDIEEVTTPTATSAKAVVAERRTFIKKGNKWVIGFNEHEISIKHNTRVFYLAHLLKNPGHSFGLLELSRLVPKKSATTGEDSVTEEWQFGKNAGVKSTIDQLNTMSEEELNKYGLSTYSPYKEDDMDPATKKRNREAVQKLEMDIAEAQKNNDKVKLSELNDKRNALWEILKKKYKTVPFKNDKGQWMLGQRPVLKEEDEKARKNIDKHIRKSLEDIKRESEAIF